MKRCNGKVYAPLTVERTTKTEKERKKADLRLSSLQCGLCSTELNTVTPESCRLFMLRYRCLRQEDCELSGEAKASQLFHVKAQPTNLIKTN